MVHAFQLRDSLALQRLVARGVSLDSPSLLTQDLHPLGNAVLALILPVFLPETLVVDRAGRTTGFGQLSHRLGDPSSRLRFLSPKELCAGDAGFELIEALLKSAGRRRAQHILADAEDRSEVSAFLRRAGFTVYAREDIWQAGGSLPKASRLPPDSLRALRDADATAVHALYCSIVPALVHQVEGLSRRPKGWLFLEDGELAGFFQVRSGPLGLWMEPFFHPMARKAADWIAGWLGALSPRPPGPVFVRVRSYQDWVGPILREFGFNLHSRRAAFVRRVVVPLPLEEGMALSSVEKPIPQATSYGSPSSRNAYDTAAANHR
ncbi:MAG: hypothetical protein JW929_02720 [Anaerolineales bacterium]|nr:hypothetical protein [Anaerolineales bacterium]